MDRDRSRAVFVLYLDGLAGIDEKDQAALLETSNWSCAR